MKTNNSERGSHTSASAAGYDAACQGRHLAQAGLPDEKSTDAESGTKVHDALLKDSDEGLSLEEKDMFDSCKAVELEVAHRYFGEDFGSNMKVYDEERLWIEWTELGLKHSGQADRMIRVGSRLLILDRKTGRNEVEESPRNMQLRDLACLAYANHSLITEIAVAIIQPFVTRTPVLCVYSAADLMHAMALMKDRVEKSNRPDATRTPGESQCKYCRAAKSGTCKEYNQWAGAMVVAVSQMDATYNILDLPASEWTPEMCSVFLDRAATAGKWLDDCKAEMKRRLQSNPGAIPGYSLGKPRVTESIVKPQDLFDRFSGMGGSLEQFMGCITVGKTKLKEQVAATAKVKGKALDTTMDGLLAGLTESKESEPSIVKTKEAK